jgi:filamentous hemagglutinin
VDIHKFAIEYVVNTSKTVSVPIGAGAFSASVSGGKGKINSTFQSVTEQSGIRAGDGGFDIVVKGNTDLKAGVITSTAQASLDNRNSLITGSLTQSSLENTAQYSASTTSLTLSYSGEQKDKDGKTVLGKDGKPKQSGYQGFNGSPPIALSANGNASSTTSSGISANSSGPSTLITDEDAQKAKTGRTAPETVASINPNVATGLDTSNALAPIFKESEIRAGFAIVGALTKEVGTFVQNRAQEADEKKAQADSAETLAKDPSNNLTDNQRLALLTQAGQLRIEAQTVVDNWGPSGTYRQITTALAAAVSGNISAASGQLVQNMLVNYVQQQGASYIGQLVSNGTLSEGSPAHAAMHAMLACAGAAASAQNCGAGAGGAAAASLLTNLFSDTNPNETQAQKEAKRNLLTSLVTGLATVTGVNAATANNAAAAAAENNWLASQQIAQMKKELKAANGLLEELKVTAKWAGTSLKQDALTTQGIGKGLAEAGWNDVKGVAEFIANPVEGLKGIKELISSPEARLQMGEAIFKEMDAKIDRMSEALKVGGDQNAEQLGKDLGGLLWQAGSVLTGAGGLAKGSVALARVGVNVGMDGLVLMAKKMPPLITGTAADAAGTFRFTNTNLPTLTTIARNDGRLGEAASVQLMKEATGKDFFPIQNASGHGADMVYIDHSTKTIYHVEVKTNQVGSTGGIPDGNLGQRFGRWIDEAGDPAIGTINGQRLPQATADFANKVKIAKDSGYTVSNNLMQVQIPRVGQSGQLSASLRPWPPAR